MHQEEAREDKKVFRKEKKRKKLSQAMAVVQKADITMVEASSVNVV